MALSEKADSVCGQVLICLRMSKLDYMVRETPYSAYVTIRKRFNKHVKEEPADTASDEKVHGLNANDKILKENSFLREKVIQLENDCAILKVEHDEIEIKLKTVEKDKAALEDDVEECLFESRKLRTLNDGLKKSEKESSNAIQRLDENVFKLKNLLKTKDLDIFKLTEQLQSLQADTLIESCPKCDPCEKEGEITSNSDIHSENKYETIEVNCEASTSIRSILKCDISCDECDMKTKNVAELNAHKIEKHKEHLSCDQCELTFDSREKLRKHMCRLNIVNPTCDEFYVKNWIHVDRCTPVFSLKKRKEVVILHSKDCVSFENRCSEYPPDYEEFYNDSWHREREDYIINGEIDWEELKDQTDIAMEEEQ